MTSTSPIGGRRSTTCQSSVEVAPGKFLAVISPGLFWDGFKVSRGEVKDRLIEPVSPNRVSGYSTCNGNVWGFALHDGKLYFFADGTRHGLSLSNDGVLKDAKVVKYETMAPQANWWDFGITLPDAEGVVA